MGELNNRRTLKTLLTVLAVAGFCTASTQQGWATIQSGFNAELAEKTLIQGVSAVAERTLDQTSIATIMVESLRGLGNIDPALSVQLNDNNLELATSAGTAATYPLPEADDVRSWARLAVTVAMDAAHLSPPLKKANTEQVLEAMFDASLSRLDLFSRYHGAAEAQRLRADRNGFGGIGVTYDTEPMGLRITSVMDQSPAALAGLLPGQLVLEINGALVRDLSPEAVIERLRGPLGSELEVLVAQADGRRVLRVLHRALIVPPTVTTTLKDGILDMQISSFNQKTADSLRDELVQAKTHAGAGFKGVILDLRGNPGGLLDQAVAAADLFIPSGTILQTRGRHPLSVQTYEAKEGDPGEGVPLVVLVDGKSASAAEILAGALEDSGRAVIIGTNSYGKGTVQTVIRLPNNGEITLTWSRFYTPSGYALHGLGILPTLCTAHAGTDPTPAADVVMRASALPHDLATWRQVQVDDVGSRAQLRDLCPAGTHGESPGDRDLAVKILTEPWLYQRALALSTPANRSLN